MSKTSEEKVQRVDEDYLFSAHQLYSICLETAVDYLVQELSTDEVDSDQSIISTGRTQIDPTWQSSVEFYVHMYIDDGAMHM